MSKAKETVEELRNKLFNRKQEEVVETAKKEIEKNLSSVAYDVIQDPTSNSRKFLIVKIKYDLDTKKAIVDDVKEFEDKSVGFTITKTKANLDFFFKKNKARG